MNPDTNNGAEREARREQILKELRSLKLNQSEHSNAEANFRKIRQLEQELMEIEPPPL